ncbi:L-rhamnose mutarotase [Thermoflavifilum aggregans]|uniref:L-rhamnose mutarotase n=1 Tax=Thermoflavifilum aggregans TaxID=454188 RepID=A0A2M9CVZ0_9BACT|nr:L-rhamnose mutarotase [Thermoflavifilum aggregans]MBX6381008.1 L-rhamnose mutarotase [Thermoflavifilum aggregans]PJJ76092.1 L-rhamnose mutarotase [Thermoflavifilum aggregans]
MKRLAFKMQLKPGYAAEYQKRHDTIWPELKQLLKETGIHHYGIYLDRETNILFAALEIENEATYAALPQHPVMQKWWKYMADIMETHPDHSPISIPLEEMFYLE